MALSNENDATSSGLSSVSLSELEAEIKKRLSLIVATSQSSTAVGDVQLFHTRARRTSSVIFRRSSRATSVTSAHERASIEYSHRESAFATESVVNDHQDEPPEVFEWYQRPYQMVHWDEPQQHPHTNWFDLFFDLIFVATAYQLGSLLSSSVDGLGFLFFATIFFSMLANWQNKLQYDSRFDSDDLFHKVVDLAEALLVAIAALHIPGFNSSSPVLDFQILSTGHAWGFALASCALRLLNLIRYVEVYLLGLISPKARSSVLITSAMHFGSFTLYGVSLVFSNSNWVGSVSGNTACALWLMASIWENYFIIFVYLIKPQSRDSRIPMNLPYCLHRWGEWIMLLIGESVLSLIVGTSMDAVPTFYAVFAFGFLTATSIQFLYYSSQPFEPSMHAMRISVVNGLMWRDFMGLFSLILVAIGVSLKILLKFHDEEVLHSEHAFLFSWSLGGAYVVIDILARQHKTSELIAGSADTRVRMLFGVLKAAVAVAFFLMPFVARSTLALTAAEGALSLFAAALEGIARSEFVDRQSSGAHGEQNRHSKHSHRGTNTSHAFKAEAATDINHPIPSRPSQINSPALKSIPAEASPDDFGEIDLMGIRATIRNRTASSFGESNPMQQFESRL